MGKREKRLKKQIEGLREQANKHREKIETETGRLETTHDYWRSEIERFERQADEKEDILEKLGKKYGGEDNKNDN